MENKNYYLGLDIGTDSVGFAATDTEYNVLKKGKKSIIGTRLFESGNTAEERRGFRSARRRGERTKQRIKFLRELFNDEISKIDPAFFQRLDESFYHVDDKTITQYNSFFNDANFKDKDYNTQYKTIYHLRKALINGDVADVRLLYLGLAHIIKNRGHFLFQGVEFGSITDFNSTFASLNELLSNDEYLEFQLNISDTATLEQILKDKTKSKSIKARDIQALLQAKPTAKQKDLISLMVGGTVKLSKLFGDDLDEEIASKSISFMGDYEKLYEEICDKLDEKIVLIDVAKAIYDWSVLIDVLDAPKNTNNEVTLSDAKIHKFNMHHEELALLKEMVKKYIQTEYKEIFENPNLKNNYPAYVGVNKRNGKKTIVKERVCSLEDFSKYILQKFKAVQVENEHEQKLLDKIGLFTAMQKQRTKENSVIPYQVHKQELELILKNNAKTFAFLNNSDGTHTIAEKIKAIFMYRIPYFVGPLNKNSSFAWIVKNLDEKIYPWNFEKVVNLESSAEAFINRMTNKCTYLRAEDVIPQKSLLYSKYTLLNELNNLKLDGQSISVELKQEIFENLFKKYKKVTAKRLKDYLIKNSYADKETTVSGIDGDFKGSLESYIVFTEILGANFDEEMVEDIIRWIVLFSDDKAMLKNKISSKYNIDTQILNKICKQKFSGWGRFSAKFLTDIYAPAKVTGEAISIIDAMYITNLNLMQLLSNEYTYISQINALKQTKADITIDDIKELYCSPAVKKSIWQAVKIVKEIEKITGAKPQKLFVEVTRAEGEKVRTNSRLKELKEKYKNIGKEYADILKELDGKAEADLRQKKLYLYFAQLGRCAYTGKIIDLQDLNSNLFDIEHIYPRSKTKDDSIHNNLVLVYKIANAEKSDTYPIPTEYRQEELWKLLYSKKLINETKYNRLMRKTEFVPKELEGFIARQLVETSQASKAVANLFESYYEGKNSKVVYVKAGNVSDFRKHFDILKVREINDYHHAHDAYLNIVVGNVWDTKFTNKFYANNNGNYSLKPEILYPVTGKKYGEYAWQAGEGGSIKTVKDIVFNANVLFTRQAYKSTGAFFDQTIYKKGQGEFAVKNPMNINKQEYNLTNLTKYGGFKSIKGAYFCVVEHVLKKKLVRTIEFVPVYIAKQIETDASALEKYLIEQLELCKPKIILKELKIGALLNVDGFPMHVSGRTGVQIVFRGAVQLKLDSSTNAYFKKLVNVTNKLKDNADYKISPLLKITCEQNILAYDLLAQKLKNSIYKIRLETQGDTLIEKRSNFEKLTLENQSKVLVNILTLFHCNAAKADLTLISGSANAGTMLISKKISEKTTVKLTNQSITGVYENSIDLLK